MTKFAFIKLFRRIDSSLLEILYARKRPFTGITADRSSILTHSICHEATFHGYFGGYILHFGPFYMPGSYISWVFRQINSCFWEILYAPEQLFMDISADRFLFLKNLRCRCEIKFPHQQLDFKIFYRPIYSNSASCCSNLTYFV